jgi:hypothetical protein
MDVRKNKKLRGSGIDSFIDWLINNRSKRPVRPYYVANWVNSEWKTLTITLLGALLLA